MRDLRSDIERYYQIAGTPKPVFGLGFLAACFNPRLVPNVFLRLSGFFYRHRMGVLAKFFAMLNVLFFGIEVSPRVEIGDGLFLPHTVGTVIGAERIGRNVTILQGVTLGTKEPDMQFTVSLRPVIGDHVLIGAGAKIIGRVTVGDYAKIGANAVILDDVPPYAVAAGAAAKVMESSQRGRKDESSVG
ncbi:MAG TPA: serine acetyltransferase [Alphaproteobacteria bacterium]|jgi:serine O-acetyltransferase|nr:serine acetyltransferase [Alphaproteobacteria bacterium]